MINAKPRTRFRASPISLEISTTTIITPVPISGPQVDPTGERDDIVIRPIRGGAFNERASRIRTASRLSQDPGAGLVIVGFRVARTYQP